MASHFPLPQAESIIENLPPSLPCLHSMDNETLIRAVRHPEGTSLKNANYYSHVYGATSDDPFTPLARYPETYEQQWNSCKPGTHDKKDITSVIQQPKGYEYVFGESASAQLTKHPEYLDETVIRKKQPLVSRLIQQPKGYENVFATSQINEKELYSLKKHPEDVEEQTILMKGNKNYASDSSNQSYKQPVILKLIQQPKGYENVFAHEPINENQVHSLNKHLEDVEEKAIFVKGTKSYAKDPTSLAYRQAEISKLIQQPKGYENVFPKEQINDEQVHLLNKHPEIVEEKAIFMKGSKYYANDSSNPSKPLDSGRRNSSSWDDEVDSELEADVNGKSSSFLSFHRLDELAKQLNLSSEFPETADDRLTKSFAGNKQKYFYKSKLNCFAEVSRELHTKTMEWRDV